MHHYITKYQENGIQYAEAWIQFNLLNKPICLWRRHIRI